MPSSAARRTAAFRAAVLRGMAASPFRGTVIYRRGTTSHTLEDVVLTEDSEADMMEHGTERDHRLSVIIPREAIDFTPDDDLDRLIYQGRTYRFTLSAGREAASPAWFLEARSPRA